MAKSMDSATSATIQPQKAGLSGWLKLGIVAGASALAAGVATAWWYRKTLNKLHQAENQAADPAFRNRRGEEGDDA